MPTVLLDFPSHLDDLLAAWARANLPAFALMVSDRKIVASFDDPHLELSAKFMWLSPDISTMSEQFDARWGRFLGKLREPKSASWEPMDIDAAERPVEVRGACGGKWTGARWIQLRVERPRAAQLSAKEIHCLLHAMRERSIMGLETGLAPRRAGMPRL